MTVIKLLMALNWIWMDLTCQIWETNGNYLYLAHTYHPTTPRHSTLGRWDGFCFLNLDFAPAIFIQELEEGPSVPNIQALGSSGMIRSFVHTWKMITWSIAKTPKVWKYSRTSAALRFFWNCSKVITPPAPLGHPCHLAVAVWYKRGPSCGPKKGREYGHDTHQLSEKMKWTRIIR